MAEAIPTTIRHARNALDMLVNGALRQIEGQFADGGSPEYKAAVVDLFANLRDELNDWEVSTD